MDQTRNKVHTKTLAIINIILWHGSAVKAYQVSITFHQCAQNYDTIQYHENAAIAKTRY